MTPTEVRSTTAQALRAAAAGGICVAVLAAMLARHAWPLWTGEPIYLKVRPVDPRDIFRGDYVILGYEIDRIEVGEAPNAVRPDPRWLEGLRGDPPRDSTVYLHLEPRPSTDPGVPQVHVPVGAGPAPYPRLRNLRGLVRSAYRSQQSLQLQLHYGIDAFFVEEKAGRPIEDAIRRGVPVYAEVLATAAGEARVKDLIIEGRRASAGRTE